MRYTVREGCDVHDHFGFEGVLTVDEGVSHDQPAGVVGVLKKVSFEINPRL